MILLTPADYKVMPWKNGLGSTLEIHRADGRHGRMDWRVSMATVAEDGPFSNFAGFDRHIMAIAGAGMVLEGGPDGPISVVPFSPCRFSGDWPVTARLTDGPVKDFNLMARREAWDSRLEVLRFEVPREIGGKGETCLIHALAGGFASRGKSVPEGCSLLASLERPLTVMPENGPCVAVACLVSQK